jgi:hypothetical protein
VWRHTSIPPIRLHGIVLSEAQGQLYLYLYLCLLHSNTAIFDIVEGIFH